MTKTLIAALLIITSMNAIAWGGATEARRATQPYSIKGGGSDWNRGYDVVPNYDGSTTYKGTGSNWNRGYKAVPNYDGSTTYKGTGSNWNRSYTIRPSY